MAQLDNKKIDDILETEFSETIPSSEQFDTESAYKKFLGMVSDAQMEEASQKHRAKIIRLMRYAAILLVIVGVGIGAYLSGDNAVRNQLADVTMKVNRGSQTSITLPDGTKVLLNVGSVISYSQAYGLKTRDVELVGEGYFEVVHNTESPFTVSTPTLCIHDIGTSFNIRDYKEDHTAEVTMTEGSVSVSDAKGNTLTSLQHDDRLVYDKDNGTFTTSKITDGNGIAWTQGVLHLDGESMADMAIILERTFDVVVVFKDASKKNLHFCCDFSYNKDKVTDVLDVLSATGKLKYTVKGKMVTIY